MANKEKDSGTIQSVEKEFNAETVKGQLGEKVEYHNKLVAEKERLLGELQKVESAISHTRGSIDTLNGVQNEYFVKDVPSVNGEV